MKKLSQDRLKDLKGFLWALGFMTLGCVGRFGPRTYKLGWSVSVLWALRFRLCLASFLALGPPLFVRLVRHGLTFL